MDNHPNFQCLRYPVIIRLQPTYLYHPRKMSHDFPHLCGAQKPLSSKSLANWPISHPKWIAIIPEIFDRNYSITPKLIINQPSCTCIRLKKKKNIRPTVFDGDPPEIFDAMEIPPRKKSWCLSWCLLNLLLWASITNC